MTSQEKHSEALDALMMSGDIVAYEYVKVYEEPGRDIRTTEELIITLPSGNKIKLETCCSGVMENTELLISSFTS